LKLRERKINLKIKEIKDPSLVDTQELDQDVVATQEPTTPEVRKLDSRRKESKIQTPMLTC
jgi:hypothetical protein